MKFLREFNEEEDRRRRALQSISLDAFKDSYVSFSRGVHPPNSVESDASAFRVFAEHIGGQTALRSITPTDCEKFLAKKAEKVGPHTVLRLYRTLKAGFTRAVTWGYVMENPWRKVKRPKAPEILPMYFSRAELRSLLSCIKSQDFRDLIQVAVLTGLRLGEMLALRWAWIDFTRKVITLGNNEHFTTKSKKARVVPLCDEILSVLLRRQVRITNEVDLVFHQKGRTIRENAVDLRFKRAIKRAGLNERLHFHSLRHTFASWLVQDGVSLYQVAKLLGHSSTVVTEVYAHLLPQDMHRVLAPLHLDK